MDQNLEIGIVILAAGESLRMGEAKQLLEFKGTTLLERTIQTALASICRPVVVVLGARADDLANAAHHPEVQIVVNADWKRGMSGSIRTGLEKILEFNRRINGVLIMVCDQPFVSAELINQIIETYKKMGSLIVACEYAGTLGVPALFSDRLFPQLLKLKNVGGAKKIIKQFKSQTTSVLFDEGVFDIDTPEDYLKLTAVEKRGKGEKFR